MVIVASVLFLNLSVSAEEKPMVDGNGRLHMVEKSLRDLTAEEGLALAQPGTEIPTGIQRTKPERKICLCADFFYLVPIQRYDRVTVFEDGEFSEKKRQGIERGEKELATYVVLLLVAIFMVAVLNVSFNKKMIGIFRILAVILIAILFFAALAAAGLPNLVVYLILILTSFVAIISTVPMIIRGNVRDIKVYKICSALFYILAAIALAV